MLRTSGIGGSISPVGVQLPIWARAAMESRTAFLKPIIIMYDDYRKSKILIKKSSQVS